MALPLRVNGQRILASWFNAIKTEIEALAANTDTVFSLALTNGMAATNIVGATFNSAAYTSAVIEYEAIRSTTHFETGMLHLQYKNSTWQILEGEFLGDNAGLTWSFTGTTTMQLRVATSSGPGTGTLKIKARRFAV